MVQFSVQSAQLSQGYDAFNAANPAVAADPNWAIVKALFCQDIPYAADPTKTEFPAWYPMDGGNAYRGWNDIFTHLQGLRAAAANAQLLDVVDHGNTSITLDYTTGGPEGAHACADKVEFDEAGLIKVFWHCSTNTHKNGHAGHAAIHAHP